MYVGKVLFLLQTNISQPRRLTHVKRHYSETDWKMSKLRLCQLKLGFFNQFPALYLSENNFN